MFILLFFQYLLRLLYIFINLRPEAAYVSEFLFPPQPVNKKKRDSFPVEAFIEIKKMCLDGARIVAKRGARTNIYHPVKFSIRGFCANRINTVFRDQLLVRPEVGCGKADAALGERPSVPAAY